MKELRGCKKFETAKSWVENARTNRKPRLNHPIAGGRSGTPRFDCLPTGGDPRNLADQAGKTHGLEKIFGFSEGTQA